MKRLLPAATALLGGVVAALPWMLALYALALHASFGRPIWIDEFLHFAPAAEPSAAEAWRVVARSIDHVNHGQTGVYMMLNYGTLSLFGANPLALRLPSLASGLLLFGGAILMFRALGLSAAWQLLAVAALTGQHLLMYFAGEARPYMPLAAASVGLLAYYLARTRWPGHRGVLAFGILSAGLGVLTHPYIAVYWPAILLVAYVHRCIANGERPGIRALVAFANPALVAAGLAVFAALASATWLRGHPAFGMDPLQWLRQPSVLANIADYSHTQFLAGGYLAAGALTVIATLGLLAVPARWRGGGIAPLLPPLLLLLLAIGLSALVAYMSWRADYWILPRQWVASAALVAVGTVWLWAEAARLWSRVTPVLGFLVLGFAAFIVQAQARNILEVKRAEWRTLAAQAPPAPTSADCVPPTGMDFAAMGNDELNRVMVDLANRNIRCGGAVWPVFRAYYAITFARAEEARARQRATGGAAAP